MESIFFYLLGDHKFEEHNINAFSGCGAPTGKMAPTSVIMKV